MGSATKLVKYGMWMVACFDLSHASHTQETIHNLEDTESQACIRRARAHVRGSGKQALSLD